MKKLITSDTIYTRQSRIPNAGRGVFAKRTLQKDDIIETCPVIAVAKDEKANLDQSMFVTYFYYFGKKKQHILLALGFGSLYNHSYLPNARYKEHIREKTIDFIASKTIKKDEEITVNYNTNPKNKHPLWFEARG